MTTAAIETAPDAQPTLEMGLSEAQHLAEQIKVATGGFVRQLGRLRELAVRFYEGRGFAAMGYATMEACARKEFGWDRVSFWRQLQAARIERELGVEIGNIPESHARELRRLPADQRKDAYDEAKQDGKTTAADVREAVERRRAPSEPLPDLAGVECFTEEDAREAGAPAPWPPGQELCIHGRDLINATCEECEEEVEQVERIPGQGKETPQDAREMAAPSKGAAPTPKPHRIEAPQSTRETVGGDGLGEIDLAEIRRNGDSVGVVMAFYRLAVAAATDEAGGQARRRIVGTLLRQARGQK